MSLNGSLILTNLALLPVLLSYLEVGEKERRAADDLDRRLRLLWSRLARVARRGPALAVIVTAAVLAAAGAHYAVSGARCRATTTCSCRRSRPCRPPAAC